MKESLSPWLVIPRTSLAAPSAVVVFPYAGGSGVTFRRWAPLLPADVGYVGVELPGRGSRFGEGPEIRADVVADAVTEALLALEARELVLFGYSMGALLAYEVACRLQDGGCEVHRLVLAASTSPSAELGRPWVSELSTKEMFEHVVALGMVHPRRVSDPRRTALVEPGLRADLRLCERYPWGRTTKVGCPAVLVAAAEDERASGDDMTRWTDVLDRVIARHTVPGGHSAVDEDDEPVRCIVLAAAAAASSARGSHI